MEQLPRRVKTTLYIPLIPTFSLKGEGAGTYAFYLTRNNKMSKFFIVQFINIHLYQSVVE